MRRMTVWSLASSLLLFCCSDRCFSGEVSQDTLRKAAESYAAGQVAAGRELDARVAVDANAGPEIRALAQLRVAHSYRQEANNSEAIAQFAKVRAIANAPAHLVREAESMIEEVQRIQAGNSPRDPQAARTPVGEVGKAGMTLYVSLDGSDDHPGTSDKPLRSLAAARDLIRKIKKQGNLPVGGVEVRIRGGQYAVDATLDLTAEDSGTETAPVVYAAMAGEKPVFTGGRQLKNFRAVQDAKILQRLPEESRGKVLQIDLREQGIKSVPPVRLGGFASGSGFRSHPAIELFCDGQAMPLARWPNEGFAKTIEARGATPATGYGPPGTKEGIFTYEGDRPLRWKDDADIVLYGYWFYGWADSYELVSSIDTGKREIRLAQPYHTYGYRGGQPFCAMNLLSEIDQPGEWYLDRQSLVLYFYPPRDLDAARVEVSLASFPFVSLSDVSHVRFEGLTWEQGCTDAVVVRGGSHCLIAGCEVRHFAGDGVRLDGGSSNGILSCDVHSMGRGGVTINGGDRKTLVRGGHFVENCHIYDLSRIDRTYTPAVLCDGVGQRISHNLLHDVRSSAMRVNGNDHLVEYNEIARVVQESDDQGGVDMFGNPTFRGNEFRFNYFHHIGNWRDPSSHPECGQAGIRLDDMISGTLIYGNIFQHCAAGKLGFGGVQIHGGKDNILDNNVFLNCASAVSFSPWPESRWRELTRDALVAPQIDRELYLRQYPELARMDVGINVNQLWRNLMVDCRESLRRNGGGARSLMDTQVSALEGDPRKLNWKLAPWNSAGFRPLPLSEIGLYTDRFRATLPELPTVSK